MAFEEIEFDLPQAWLSDKAEPGAPLKITHGCDYGFEDRDPNKGENYHCNFLVYEWSVEGRAFHARAYLDEVREIAVFLEFDVLRTEPFAEVVRWLQRRFSVISTFEQDYIARWKRRTSSMRG